MVNSSSVNVGRWETTPGEDIPAQGRVSLHPEGFSKGPRIFLGQHCWPASLAKELGKGAKVGPAVCPMVRRRNTQRVRERRGQAREIMAQEQSCLFLGGRSRRTSHNHISRTLSRSQQVRQHSATLWPPEGRHSGDLYAFGARVPDRNARLCQTRTAVHSGLFRLQREGTRRANPRLRGQDRCDS